MKHIRKVLVKLFSGLLAVSILTSPITGLAKELVNVNKIPQLTDIKMVIVDEAVDEGDSPILVGPKVFKGPSGKNILTKSVEVHPTKLLESYNNATTMDFDYKGKYKTINVLWEFLRNESNLEPELVAAIIGHVAMEGDFGIQQGTYKTIDNIKEAEMFLVPNAKSIGYGVIQWTFAERRNLLLKYYKDVYEILEDESRWTEVALTAECCCLLEEMKGYGILDDYNNLTGNKLESAVGLLSMNYIGYQGYTEDWSKSGNTYTLINSNSSGADRLAYSKEVYEYFMN